MYTLKVGSFLLNGQILLILAFGFAGWAALSRYGRRLILEMDLGSISFHAFLIWILVWKGSLLILDPIAAIQYPLSMVYYDGGEKGRWVAGIVTVGYLSYRTWKGSLSFRTATEVATVYLLGGATVYHIGLCLFEPEMWTFHIAFSALTLFMLLSFFIPSRSISWIGVMKRWLWLCIGLAVIWFMNPERSPVLLSFTFNQLICIAAAIWLFISMTILERRKE